MDFFNHTAEFSDKEISFIIFFISLSFCFLFFLIKCRKLAKLLFLCSAASLGYYNKEKLDNWYNKCIEYFEGTKMEPFIHYLPAPEKIPEKKNHNENNQNNINHKKGNQNEKNDETEKFDGGKEGKAINEREINSPMKFVKYSFGLIIFSLAYLVSNTIDCISYGINFVAEKVVGPNGNQTNTMEDI